MKEEALWQLNTNPFVFLSVYRVNSVITSNDIFPIKSFLLVLSCTILYVILDEREFRNMSICIILNNHYSGHQVIVANGNQHTSPPGMHNSLMGTKNQEVKLQEITAKATWRIQGGEDLYKPMKEDSSKSIPYFKYCSCGYSYTAF